MEGEWCSYGQFNGGSMAMLQVASLVHMLQRWTLMEGEWSRYRSGHFNGGRMVMLQRWSLMDREWSSYRSGH